MKVAVVGLNSLFPCGVSAFMFHLTHMSDWKLIIANEKGSSNTGDMNLQDRISNSILRVSYNDLDILSSYDIVIFGASRWGGDYRFLNKTASKLRGLGTKIGFIAYDITEFERMGLYDLMNMFNKSYNFCIDDTVKNSYNLNFKKIKMPYNPKYIKRDGVVISNKMRDRGSVIVPTRNTPSKNRNITINNIPESIPVKVFGERDDKFGKNVKFIKSDYNDAMLKHFGDAVAIIDGSRLPKPHPRPQYTFMDAWLFGCVPICSGDWFDNNDMIQGITCLELNEKNINLSWNDRLLSREIGANGWWKLMVDHRSSDVRELILEYIQ